MTNRFKAFWLGLFIIMALALLAWAILFLRPIVGDGKVTLKVRFSNVDKVTEGTRVTVAGKPVGEVKQIVEVPDPRKGYADENGNLYIYELTLKVDSSVKVYTYDEILFATSGLLGEKSIVIIPKAPPVGAPEAKDVTDEILFAKSTDKLEEALNQLTNVAGTVENTLDTMNNFLETNTQDFNIALKSFHGAATEVQSFIGRANEIDVAGKASAASDRLTSALVKAESLFDSVNGEGTIGRLLNSDCTFVQLTTVLCQIQAVLYDIKTYGLLYQFDRKWQRTQSRCTQIPCGEYCQQ